MIEKIAQAFSDYIYDNFEFEQQYVVLNYEEELGIETAKLAAAVFAGNGVNCYLFEEAANEKDVEEAIAKLECPAGITLGKNGFRFYNAQGIMSDADAAAFASRAEAMTEDDIVTSDFGVSFSFMRIMYIKP